VVVTTATVSRAKLQSNHHHQRKPNLFPVAQPTVSKHWRENITLHGLAHPKLAWVFQLCLWPLRAPGYLRGGLPCLSSALWCQYPKTNYTTTVSTRCKNTIYTCCRWCSQTVCSKSSVWCGMNLNTDRYPGVCSSGL